ncbi:unnamed protein product [Brassicogethes aeneus]|uniref:Rrn7/TAF1B C-terminal cyclin domain-containing protein n=1 Tax=Brassicogethes aeneus TaxID=1431903 RepID=A0A9P0AZV0_BRAAE|nr:unnamed protein product [Brassicogethes aeneus]
MPDVECDVCGGNDFYKESGHYFCKDCQTQTQEIQEHVFENEIEHVNIKSTTRVKKSVEKKENKITSWECYNIILYSLTNQLINLGADPKLKEIVKCLWMLYLEKLEVINREDEMPKLPIINNRKDSEILYGRRIKKRRRRSSSDETSTSLNTSLSIKRDRGRKKRALAESQLEELSKKSAQESSSLHNETLTSIKSGSNSSTLHKTRINKHSVKELRKVIGREHMKRHKRGDSITCHSATYKNASKKHKITVISPMKLYSLLYIGLLINKDDIQLGDLLRFINEGHISFDFYSDLFPEEYHDKVLNFNNHTVNKPYTNMGFRKQVAGLVILLGVQSYLTIPDLPRLCKRFCKELNLPGPINDCAVKLMCKALPKMLFQKQGVFPNYEGRVLSIILVVLKLLFGLDGATENEFSKYSKLCNEKQPEKMFDVNHWLKYLGYRKFVIDEYHFPTQLNNNPEVVDSDLYLEYISTKPKQYSEDVKLIKYMEDYKELLTKLNNVQDDFFNPLEFPCSLTPFKDYTEVLLKSFKLQNKDYNRDLLSCNFSGDSIDFLLQPNNYLNLVNNGENFEIIERGANENVQINDIKNEAVENRDQRLKDRKVVTVQKKNKDENLPLFDTKNTFKPRKPLKIEPTGSSYTKHYNPFKKYWVNFIRYPDLMSKHKFDIFFNDFPDSFKTMFLECSRISEQNIQELFLEFQLTEAYLVYVAQYKPRDDPPKVVKVKLKNLVSRAKKNW